MTDLVEKIGRNVAKRTDGHENAWEQYVRWYDMENVINATLEEAAKVADKSTWDFDRWSNEPPVIAAIIRNLATERD